MGTLSIPRNWEMIMAGDKMEPLSEIWSARYDDRDDEAIAWHVWAQKMAVRDEAMANPIKNFELPEEGPSEPAGEA
jgi:hypothetical protein